MSSKPYAYYNEFDPFAAAWLKALIDDGHIMDGAVDSRSIVEVQPYDLKGFTRCHFFAGIGGWDYALRLANWPESRPVWTGSCPCQPFSTANKYRKGHKDKRDLWPIFYRLISHEMPAVVFGEQVSNKHGLAWFDKVSAQMEEKNFEIRALLLPAISVEAPHERQRLFFMAHSNGNRLAAWKHTISYLTKKNPLPVFKATSRRSSNQSFWDTASQIKTHSGRRYIYQTKPQFFPLAARVPSTMGRLRGYGNAIIPQLGAYVVRGFLESELPHPL